MIPPDTLEAAVAGVLASTQVIDMHTHLFAPGFGSLGLWGIDHLLTYHYLEAELFRSSPIRPEQYWALTTAQRADLIWKTLFVENNPISEAARGVIAVLHELGLDTSARTLAAYRDFFREQNLTDHIARVFRLAGIESVVMTNDPLDPEESPLWDSFTPDPRFHATLRAGSPPQSGNQPHTGRSSPFSRKLGDPHARRVHGRLFAGFSFSSHP